MTALDLPNEATVVEMLPRDGFQRHSEFIPTETKIEIIDKLSTTGIREIEITSFSHPNVVPQLRDAEEVATGIDRNDDVRYRALVPNAIGMRRAINADIKKVNALVVVSDGYRKRNQGMTLEENLSELAAIVELGEDHGIDIEAGVGMGFFCPYDGDIPQNETVSVIDEIVNLGINEMTVATSMGLANPLQVHSMITRIEDRHPSVSLGLHLHDTNGQSLANTLIALQLGIDRFDASLCGLGGGTILPSALSGIGNTPTEDLVNMLGELGIDSNADLQEIVEIATYVAEKLGLSNPSHALMGGTKAQIRDMVGSID